MFKLIASLNVALALNSDIPKIKRVCVKNLMDDLSDMNFKLTDDYTSRESKLSRTIYYTMDACMDLTEVPNIAPGDLIDLVLNAKDGATERADTPVIFDADGDDAVFQCRGLNIEFDCRLPALLSGAKQSDPEQDI